MEGLPMVCYSTGPMNSLLDKLTNLKIHSNPTEELPELTENLEGDMERLKRDFMDKFAGQRKTDKQVKVWMKQVRELVFDVEEWIDLKPKSNTGDPPERKKWEEFKARIDGAVDRCNMYNLLNKLPTQLDHANAAPSNITIDPRLLVEEKICHGVIDEPRDQLMKHLLDEQERLKVVSIVGIEGLGKTTLAKEIYAELQLHGQFECQAFVSVGRRPAIREILNDILLQVKIGSRIYQDLQRIITELREYLSMKRYLILVDGIWSTWAWKVINCALPAENCGSRVLATTCIMDVGKSCSRHPNDVVYRMEALSERNSRILFLNRMIFNSRSFIETSGQFLGEKERSARFEEVSSSMLNMFGGMPLAIIVASGLLAWKSQELAESNMLEKYILSSLMEYSTSGGLKKVLQLCYEDLSPPLRSCFLYLSLFPEDCIMKKDRLIRLWLAEGLIPRRDEGKRYEESSWGIGERYFNELIGRCLIQPVFEYKDDQAVGCTIHGVILDLVRSLSREENFATRAAELSCGPFPCDTIRRFSIDCGHEDEAGTLSTRTEHLSSIRSLIVSGDVDRMFSPLSPSVSEEEDEAEWTSVQSAPTGTVYLLSAFKVIRVMDLEDTKNLKDHHLEGIGGLVLLRYLGLGGTAITRLPQEIVQLEKLETLDVRRTVLVSLPESIVKLQKLVRLLLNIHASEIDRIWEMQELEEVSNLPAYSSRSLGLTTELLSKSKQLRVLGVTLDRSRHTENDPIPFIEEVVKSKLHSLSINCQSCTSDRVRLLLNAWKKVTTTQSSAVKFEPRRFELIISGCNLEILPPNMSCLVCLTHLHIRFSQVQSKYLVILGGLPNLVLLDLTSVQAPLRCCIIEKGVFLCLKVLLFACNFRGMGLEFREGAMPQLQRLCLSFRTTAVLYLYGHYNFGVKHLTCFKRVHATIDCTGATVSQVEAAETRIRKQVSEKTNKQLTLELRREFEDKMDKANNDDFPINDEEVRKAALASQSCPNPLTGSLYMSSLKLFTLLSSVFQSHR